VAVSTPEVFRRLENKNNGPLPDRWRADTFGFLAALAACRNDLEAPAQSLAPVITDVLEALSALEGVALVRMSGSGATCFALFATADMAIAAADGLSAARPDWWVRAAPLRTPCEGYG
jgi:4-diphosphocytidyl-2-C-methyl-D-erythritol kinase